MSYSLVVGDLEPDMEIDAVDYNGSVGTAAVLTGATDVSLRWKKPDGTVITVPLVVIDLATGRLKRVWVAGDSDQEGVHFGQVVVTLANGELRTYPNDGSQIIWWVYPRLD
jgi:hypothetical protein